MPTACPEKALAEIDFLVSQTNTTAAGDHDGFVVEGIVDVGQPGVGTGPKVGRSFRRDCQLHRVLPDLYKEVTGEPLRRSTGPSFPCQDAVINSKLFIRASG
jgi:hypothetical protein